MNDKIALIQKHIMEKEITLIHGWDVDGEFVEKYPCITPISKYEFNNVKYDSLQEAESARDALKDYFEPYK